MTGRVQILCVKYILSKLDNFELLNNLQPDFVIRTVKCFWVCMRGGWVWSG